MLHATAALHAFASLGMLQPSTMPHVVAHACSLAGTTVDAQHLCNLAWALAVAEVGSCCCTLTQDSVCLTSRVLDTYCTEQTHSRGFSTCSGPQH